MGAISKNDGTLVGELLRYEPFGDARGTQPSSDITDRGFTGHRENRDIGLTYMNARYYVGEIGRFASADTLVPDPMDPQSFNRYAYVYNNPLTYADPSGHYVCASPQYCAPPTTGVPGRSDARNLTPWIVEEVNMYPDLPEKSIIEFSMEPAPASPFPNCMFCGYYVFYQLVKDGAPLDVKDRIERIDQVIQLGEYWFEFSTAGNIIFGFYGAAWGFADVELHGGAGVAQLLDKAKNAATPLGPISMFFDTPDDYYAVDFGIQLYYQAYAPDGVVSVAEFNALLADYSHLAQMTVATPPTSISSPAWPYHQGAFYNDLNVPNSRLLFPTFAP